MTTHSEMLAYLDALKERDRKTALWLGLKLDEVTEVDTTEEYGVIAHVTYVAIAGQTPSRGQHGMVQISGQGDGEDMVVWHHGTVYLSYDDGKALLEHIGPKPPMPGLDDPAFARLREEWRP